MLKRSLIPVVVLMSLFLTPAQAATPPEQLQQMVEQLQKTPDDHALRERLIELAGELAPAPAIPEAARRFSIRGKVLLREAKTAADAEAAIAEYRNALAIAPWQGELYANVSRAYELAGRYDEAIRSMRFYLLTDPQDARAARDRMYELEARRELAQRRNAAPEPAPAAGTASAATHDRLERLYAVVKTWDRWMHCRPSEPAQWAGCRRYENVFYELAHGDQNCTLEGEQFVCKPPAGFKVSKIAGVPQGDGIGDIEWTCHFDNGKTKVARSWADAHGGAVVDCWRPRNEAIDDRKRLPRLRMDKK